MVDLADIEAAATRIEGRVRRTPLIAARALQHAPAADLLLKLENLQVTGSFKARGATNGLLCLTDEEVRRGIVTASSGNHGLAVAYAGWQAGTRAVIHLPRTTAASKIDRLKAWGAEVVIEGEVWDEANQAALAATAREGLTYLHPFANPNVIAGQGTVGLEMLQDAPEIDLLLIAIGGGGLISGVATAAKALKPGIRVLGVEPAGAPTLKASLAAGEPVTLPGIQTGAIALAPRRSEAINLDIVRRRVDGIVLVDDREMREAARWLWFEMGIAAELAGAAALGALLSGRVENPGGGPVGVLICGAGTDGIPGAAA